MKTLCQPFEQTGFGRVEVDTAYTYLGESQPLRPLLQLFDQLPILQVTTLLHAPILETRTWHWPDEAACERQAARLATSPALREAFIELCGSLGAGKTTFARHLLRALGVQGRIKSPSFAVMESYDLPGLPIAHIDFYRFDDAHEWHDAGLRDVFAAPGLKIVEWPDKAQGLLPTADLRLDIRIVDEHQRRVAVQAMTARGVELLR